MHGLIPFTVYKETVEVVFREIKTLLKFGYEKKRIQVFRKLDYFFFNLGFLSRTFTNHRTAGEGHFFNSSLPLPPASQALRH